MSAQDQMQAEIQAEKLQKMTPEERTAYWKAKGEEAMRAYHERHPDEPPEPVYRFIVEFDCTPSTFERIKEEIQSRRTANRAYRYYTRSRKKPGEVVTKTWQSPTSS